jgi:hypothetical protein
MAKIPALFKYSISSSLAEPDPADLLSSQKGLRIQNSYHLFAIGSMSALSCAFDISFCLSPSQLAPVTNLCEQMFSAQEITTNQAYSCSN